MDATKLEKNLYYISMLLYLGVTLFITNYIFKKFLAFSYIHCNININLFIDKKIAFVSSFYPLKGGIIRHPIDEYINRFSKLFKLFNNKLMLYVFTNNEGEGILKLSKNFDGKNISFGSHIKLINKYQNIFDVPKIAERKKEYEEIGEIMKKECSYNVSAEIGAIWNAKFCFLQEVIEFYSIDTKLYFWIDIGIFKTDDLYKKIIPLEWPSVNRIEKIFSFETDQQTSSEKVYTNKILTWGFTRAFERARSLEQVNLAAYDIFILAGFFGGPRALMLSFINEYWRIQDYLIKKKQYVLREEFLIAAYMALNKNNIFMLDTTYQRCNQFESCVSFIYHTNLCKFDNSVHFFVTRGGRYLPVSKSLGSWL